MVRLALALAFAAALLSAPAGAQTSLDQLDAAALAVRAEAAAQAALIAEQAAAITALQAALAADEALLHPPPGPRPALGAYFGTLSSSTPTTLATYENALARPVGLIVQFNGEQLAYTGSGSIASAAAWLLGLPTRTILQAPRRLAYAVHLGINKPSSSGLSKAAWDRQGFAEIAAGSHDDAYRAVANSLVNNGFADAYIRLGQEANGDWFFGCACSDPVGFAAAWNHVAALFRSISPKFAVVLDFAADRAITKYTAGINWDLAAGVNVDVYDKSYYGTTPDARWIYLLSHGITETIGLAKSHGKPALIFEWGLGAMGDNPSMVTRMAALGADPANGIGAMAYWQSNSAYPGILSPTSQPLAWAEYVRAFGGP